MNFTHDERYSYCVTSIDVDILNILPVSKQAGASFTLYQTTACFFHDDDHYWSLPIIWDIHVDYIFYSGRV